MTIYKGLRYYKYVYEDWTQPVLTANGTMGGDSFAVSASNYYDSPRQPFNAFDGKNAETSGCWHSTKGTTQWIAWYNPKPLKYSKITIMNRPATPHAVKDYQIQVSDDGSIWDTVYSGTNTVSAATTSWDIDLSSINPVSKYMRLYADTSHGEYIVIGEITITAQEQHVVESTKDDYDYATPIKIKDSGRGVFVGSKNTNCLTYTPKHVDVELDPLNVNVTGTWGVIADGVAKGFSTSQYLKIDNKYKSTNNAEYVFKFTTGSSVTTNQIIFHSEYLSNLEVKTDGKFHYHNWGSKTSQGWISAVANTTYWVKILVNDTSRTYSISIDGINYTDEVSFTDSNLQPSNTSYDFRIGLSSYDSSGPFKGSIDLSQSYININGERWWSGDSYTKVGSWIDNGVVGSFTSANYLQLPTAFSPESNTWEIVLDFTTNDKVSTEQGIMGGLGNYEGCTPFYIVSSNWVLHLSSNGSSWNIASEVVVMPLLANTKYRCKVEFTGNEYVCSSYNFDNGEWEVKKTVTSASAIYGGLTQQIGTNRGQGQPFLGTIDLTQSYIKINDEIWWQGGTGDVTLKQGSKVFVPNGFSDYDYYKYQVTKVGTPSLYNGVASGFSKGNLLTISETLNVEDKNWERVIKIKTGTDISTNQTVWGTIPDYKGLLLRITSGKLYFWVSSNGTSWNTVNNIASSLTLLANTDYYIKISFNGSQYLVDVSTDGLVYTNYITATSSALITVNEITMGGHAPSTTSFDTPFLGSIDLSQSYIKINDELWWSGAEIVTPDDYDFTIGKGEQLFNELIIPNDISAQSSANSEHVVCYSPTTNRLCFVDNNVYDSANNVMSGNISLPVARCTADNVSITSIDEVFDWYGRISNTVFVLPDVKGFIAKGYKDTGTYNSTEFTVNKVLTADLDVVTDRSLLLNADKLDYVESNYNKKDNLLLNADGEVIDAIECGKVTSDGTAITSLTPYVAQPLTTAIPIKFVYSGSQLVYVWQPYEPNTVILYGASTGTKTYILDAGLYQCCVVGGGWANRDNWSNAGGAAVEIQFRLTEKSTVVVYSGGLGHTAYLNINGARVATANTASGQNSGGSYSIDTASPYYVSTIVARNGGNANLSVAGSVSPYGNWGAGTSAGGVRLEYITY